MASKTLLELIQEYGIEIKDEGSVLRIFCPFHDDKHKPNLTLYPETDSYYCFACGESGDAADFVSQVEGIDISQALKKVHGTLVDMGELQEMIDGLDVENEESVYNKDLNILLSKKVRKCLQCHSDQSEEIFKYLKRLDLTLENPISYKKMQEILKTSDLFFKKFV